MTQKPLKRHLVFCEICSYKQVIEGDIPKNLFLIKRSKIPANIPILDPVTKKTKTSNDKVVPKMCKCPKCGRGATIKDLPEVYKKTFQEIDELERKRQAEIEKKKRLEDGKPHERNVNEDFIG